MSEQKRRQQTQMVPYPSRASVPERDLGYMPVLECSHLGIEFGGLKAVDDFSVVMGRTEIGGLIGPNGAGKTTIFNLLTKVYQPTHGTMMLEGRDMGSMTTVDVSKAGIARTFQNIRLFNNMSVIRNVMVGLHNCPEYACNPFVSMLRLPRHFKKENEMVDKAIELLEIFGLGEEKNNLACNLPYGKQRKLEIARALATKPKLLLLDEPAAGMNPQETSELMETIRFIRDTFDLTVLLIEHDMSLVNGICEQVTVLNFGTTLATGPVSEVLSDPKVITAYLGTDD